MCLLYFPSYLIMLCTPFLYFYTVIANILVKVLRDAPSLHHMKPHLSSLKDTSTVKFRDVGRPIRNVLRECSIQDSAIADKLTGLCSTPLHYCMDLVYRRAV